MDRKMSPSGDHLDIHLSYASAQLADAPFLLRFCVRGQCNDLHLFPAPHSQGELSVPPQEAHVPEGQMEG